MSDAVEGLSELWEKTRGAKEICIAILDGPADLSHSCFAGSNLKVLDAPGSARFSGAAVAHGTHIAGMLFGNHRSSIKGLAPNCRGIILPIFSDAKDGSIQPCSQTDLARAIYKAMECGAHIINISAGQLSATGEPDSLLAGAIKTCAENNVLLIAAAGNDGCECLHVPAAADHVLAVGAMDRRGRPLRISNWGRKYRVGGILAPGQRIPGPMPSGKTGEMTGTSAAAPIVSGIAALLMSLRLRKHQMPDPHHIRGVLLGTAHPCFPRVSRGDCSRYMAGKLNVPAAHNQILYGGKMKMSNQTQMQIDNTNEAKETMAEGLPISMPVPREKERELRTPPIPSENFEMSSIASIADKDEGGGPQDSSVEIPPRDDRIRTSACGCAGNSPSLVYALGTLGFNFGTEARRDSFTQSMPPGRNNPGDPVHLLDYLDQNPFEAQSIIWTLNLDVTPIYAIQPQGPFAGFAYERLREELRGQNDDGVDLISIPGRINGNVTLSNGQTVPRIEPDPGGIYGWAAESLAEGLLGKRPDKDGEERLKYDDHRGGLDNFLNRVYYDLRNLGLAPQERALNYAATNAFQVAQVMESASRGQLELDSINVVPSPVCRPDSDCYDVELKFFNPDNLQSASKVYRFTVDVSDVIPVTIGQVRSWSRR